MSLGSAGGIRAGRAYVEIGATFNELGKGLRQAQAMVQRFAAGIGSLGSAMAKAGSAGLLPFAAAGKTFATFEQNMARVRSILKPTESDFAALNDEAMRIGATTIFTASDAAEAMFTLAQAGFSTKEILAAAAPAVKLAASNVMTLQQATGGAISTLRGMGLGAEETMRVLDVLGSAANSSYTDVNLLASGFAYVAPAAKAAGMQIEDVAAALGVFSDAGVRGERAGTTLRAMLADLQKLTPEAKQQLSQLGVALQDSAGNWRPLSQIFRDLQKALKATGAGSYQASQMLSKIFDIRSGAGAQILLENLDKFDALSTKLRNAGGTIEEMEKIQLGTLTGSIKILLSTLEALQIHIGKAIAPTIRSLADAINPLVNGLSEWTQRNGQLVVGLLGGAAATVGLGLALVGLSTAISSVATVGGLALGVLGGLVSVATAVAGPGVILTGVLGAVAAGLFTLSDGGRLVLSFLGTLGTYLTKIPTDFTAISRGVAAFGQGVAQTFRGIAADLKQMASILYEAVSAGDMELAGRVLAVSLRLGWSEGMAGLAKATSSLFDGVITGISELMINTMGSAARTVMEIWNGVLDAISVAYAQAASLWDSKAETNAGKAIADRAAVLEQRLKQSRQRQRELIDSLREEQKGNLRKPAENKEAEELRKQLAALGAEARAKSLTKAIADAMAAGIKAAQEATKLAAGGQPPGSLGQLATGGVGEIIGTFSGDRLLNLGPSKSLLEQIANVEKNQLAELRQLNRNIRDLEGPKFA